MPGLRIFLAGQEPAALLGSSGPAKKIPLIEMRGILHEKIQLYIYKPSINSGMWSKNKLPVLRGVY
jgi:hypothetical protein